jgi:hypothetical protein
MSLPIRFLPYSVNLNTNSGVSAWINQIESTAPDDGVVLFEETTGSEVDRQFVAAKDIMPVMPFVTSDLSVLTTCGMSGVPINSGSSKPGLLSFGRELPLEAVPTPIATAHHLQLAVSDGLLVPVSVRATHNQVAKLAMMLHGMLGTAGTSGATPFVWTASSAIISGAAATLNIYTTGPVKYTISGGASRLVQGIAEVNLEFGIQVLKDGSDGEVYPSHLSIISRMSKIEFSTKDIELVSEIGDGLSCSAFAVYFRNVAQNGQRVAPATATHVSASSTLGMLTSGAARLQHKQPGVFSATYTPSFNSALMTLSATAAIPTS